MEMNEKIKSLRLKKGLTLEQVGKYVGVGKSTVRKWETGMIENMRRDKIAKLAAVLGTTPEYLMGWEEEKKAISSYPGLMPITTQRIPLLGEIACGKPIFCDEDRESYVECGTNIHADFCLRCKGDSMIGARIHDGDIVFIREQDSVDNGQVAAVIIGDEATLKRIYYYPEKAKLILQAENPKYEPLVYIGDELSEIHILGKAVAFQSDVI